MKANPCLHLQYSTTYSTTNGRVSEERKDLHPRPFLISRKLRRTAVDRQAKCLPLRPLPFGVRPDEQGKHLRVAQLAALPGQLLLEPGAVALIGRQRPAGQELEGVALAAMPVGRPDQVQELPLQPRPRYLRRRGMGGGRTLCSDANGARRHSADHRSGEYFPGV